MKPEADSKHSSPHAAAARRAIMQRLRDLGHPRMDLDTAIRRGILTELDWCQELDRQRDAYGAQAQGGSKLTAEQAEAAVQRARQKSREYYHRQKALWAAQ